MDQTLKDYITRTMAKLEAERQVPTTVEPQVNPDNYEVWPEQPESDDPRVWAQIARLFPELAMNIEQVAHGVGELGKIKSGGGTRSRNIPKGI
jgi:hypothetical protein